MIFATFYIFFHLVGTNKYVCMTVKCFLQLVSVAIEVQSDFQWLPALPTRPPWDVTE